MKTVLITGVAGFLGRYVARHFVREGWRVMGIDDVPPENVQLTSVAFHRLQLPSTALPEILRAATPDVCVHCAGRASVGLSMTDPAADFLKTHQIYVEVQRGIEIAYAQHGVQKTHFRFSLESIGETRNPSDVRARNTRKTHPRAGR